LTEALTEALPPATADLVEDVLHRACARDMMIVTAESCTGGFLASLLTDVEGCSHAFERGFVVYTEAAKQQQLGVDPALIKRDTAVSESVARAMAEGALRNSEGHLALSITGYAGHPGDNEGEEGLVHFALARHDGPTLHREEHFGACGRGDVRVGAVKVALEMLRAALD
jgi:nicotinamide-nucleotide amidase